MSSDILFMPPSFESNLFLLYSIHPLQPLHCLYISSLHYLHCIKSAPLSLWNEWDNKVCYQGWILNWEILPMWLKNGAEVNVHLLSHASMCSLAVLKHKFSTVLSAPWPVHNKRNANHSQNCRWKTDRVVICRKDWVATLSQMNVHGTTCSHISANLPLHVSKINFCPGSHFWLWTKT